MPTYEYRCEAGHEFEKFQKMSDTPASTCPTCGGAAERKISAGAGLVFKGSGFYITDYKNKPGPADSASGDSAGGDGKSPPQDASKSSPKPTKSDASGTGDKPTASGGASDGGAEG